MTRTFQWAFETNNLFGAHERRGNPVGVLKQEFDEFKENVVGVLKQSFLQKELSGHSTFFLLICSIIFGGTLDAHWMPTGFIEK